jgi:MarR family transcriptional regulator, lower aerobic nicotinate degradation pathway regulator
MPVSPSRTVTERTRPQAPNSDRSEPAVMALDALRRIVRALGISARTAERSAGVTGAQLFVLQQLREAPAHSLNDLANRTFTHQSTVSVVVDRLVSRGLVARTRSETDARQVELSLTPAGRAALRRAPPPAQSRLIAALRALPASECRRLARTLGLVVRQMRVTGGPPGMFFMDPIGHPAARARPAKRPRKRSALRHPSRR